MNEITIGVLGGMGTYATIKVFQDYADVFKANREWERPRIIIDNRCTMPSRVRAILYNEERDELIQQMSESLIRLVESGCNRIIIGCNTAHIFLPYIYELHPSIKPYIVDIIDACARRIQKDNNKEVYLLASEGTIESNVYGEVLSAMGIRVIVPSRDRYNDIRICIEAVKQNKYTDEVKKVFCSLMSEAYSYVLACTELPILYDKYKSELEQEKNVYNPICIAMRQIKGESIG